MTKIPHTTVVLTEEAQEIKYDLAPVFGLKSILSAGLILLARLNDTEQKILIGKVNSKEKFATVEKARKDLSYEKQSAREDEAAAASKAEARKRKKGQPLLKDK